ncbi:MAG TPA: histidine phosphatase family protein [Xanthobacteraceae bacterium]|jgi:phosphohistidine phosphatase|nr:histidine phosphatase family protein [Xanthobacteraceae bacterium]
MRRLILLRHAKSDWASAGARDEDRVLAPRGREAAPKIGAYIAHHGLIPDLVLCSPAARTRQTWDLAAQALTPKPQVSYEPRLYGAGAEELLRIATNTKSDVHTLLLVGHNPGLQDFAGLLIASGNIDARQQLHDKFPTCGLAAIDFPIDDWRKVHARAGRLDRFIIPRSLERATD